MSGPEVAVGGGAVVLGAGVVAGPVPVVGGGEAVSGTGVVAVPEPAVGGGAVVSGTGVVAGPGAAVGGGVVELGPDVAVGGGVVPAGPGAVVGAVGLELGVALGGVVVELAAVGPASVVVADPGVGALRTRWSVSPTLSCTESILSW